MAVLLGAALAVVGFLREAGSSDSSAPIETSSAAESSASTAVAEVAAPSDAVLESMNLGLEAFESQEFEAAVGYFESTLLDFPDSATAHQYLGLSLYWLEDYNRAMASIERALELHPDSRAILDHYVTLSKELGDLEGAAGALEDFAETYPRDESVLLELARLARDRDLPREALQHTELLLRQAPDSALYNYEHAITLKQAGDMSEAKTMLERAVEIDPDVAPAQHSLGVVALLSGDARNAVEPLERAVALEPGNGGFHFSLAQAYEKLERVDESLSSYESYLLYADKDDPKAQLVRKLLRFARQARDEERRRASRGQVGG